MHLRVATLFHIHSVRAKFLNLDLNLGELCIEKTPDESLIKIGTNFLAKLYGRTAKTIDLNHLRYQIFSERKDPPKLKSLRSTNEAAANRIKRAYLQTLIWSAAGREEPPKVD